MLYRKIKKRLYLFSQFANVQCRFWIPRSKIDSWSNTVDIFFILAIGRSGTKFLSQLLNKAENAYVLHEPLKVDRMAYKEAYYNEMKARNYIKIFRKKYIYLMQNRIGKQYGEVNSFLRRHSNALKKEFPKVKLIHLIRDGRDVVRSMFSRETMNIEDENTQHIIPKKNSPFYNRWKNMTRFEKLCWYWKNENNHLRINIKNMINFEKIISDYDYFSEKVLNILGLEISEFLWEKERNKPKNITTDYTLPKWPNWTEEEKSIFNEICGEEMRLSGYYK
jgi:hypothetical protein